MRAARHRAGDSGAAPFAVGGQCEPVRSERPVHVSYSCDGRYFGIRVADEYGSIDVKQVSNYLSQYFKSREIGPTDTGTKIGLYVVFSALSSFVLNVQPGTRTELIGLLDLRGATARTISDRSRSFNIFLADGA